MKRTPIADLVFVAALPLGAAAVTEDLVKMGVKGAAAVGSDL
jgi:hypothetical protein